MNNMYLPKGEYVYVIRDNSVTRYSKIGRTNNPNRRIGELDCKLPFEIKIEALYLCENAVVFERTLHDTFSHLRVRGEWFDLGEVEYRFLEDMADYASSYARLVEYTGTGMDIAGTVVRSVSDAIGHQQAFKPTLAAPVAVAAAVKAMDAGDICDNFLNFFQ